MVHLLTFYPIVLVCSLRWWQCLRDSISLNVKCWTPQAVGDPSSPRVCGQGPGTQWPATGAASVWSPPLFPRPLCVMDLSGRLGLRDEGAFVGWTDGGGPLRFQDPRTCRALRNFPRLGVGSWKPSLPGKAEHRGSCQGLLLGMGTQEGGRILPSSLER